MNRIGEVAATAALALSIGPATAAEKQWVQGSWVNLRAEAAANGTIVDRLIVNTEVALLSKQGTWCEVTAKTPEVRGFVACSLLGAQAVTLAEVGSPELEPGKPNPRYSAPRAFWLAPSMVRLQKAGDHFWSTMLTPAQQAKERPNSDSDTDADKRPPPVRYAIPEFEAMKDLMKRGVVAAPEMRPALVPWAELQQEVAKIANGNGYGVIRLSSGRYVDEAVVPMVRNARLPPARPSYFQRQADLAPLFSGVEQLSAQFGIVERLKVLGGAKWVSPRHNYPYVAGNWDIGSFEVTLERPVLEYMVGRRGLAGMREWTATWHYDEADEDSCGEGLPTPREAARSLPDYPRVKDPLVWLNVAKPVPFKQVRVATAARKLPAPAKDQGERSGLTTIFMHDVDIDGDGAPDLAVWEGMQRDGNGGDTLGVRVVFANIGGEWFLLDSHYLVECS